jgi:sigma-B regulation protein RsbU (phosphoserine phosphatase)
MPDQPSGFESAAAARAPDLSLARLEQDETLALLHQVSRELTSILARDELFRRIAERVRKVVHYHLFNVMLWHEQAGLLQSIFSVEYEGVFFYVRTVLYIGLSAAAIKVKNQTFHAAFAIFAVVCEVALILKSYLTIT